MADCEEWRAIPGLEFYQASSLGRIRSLDRTLDLIGRWGPMRRFHAGRILVLKKKPNGCGQIYHQFFAGEDGGYWQVNRAVCLSFHGDPPSPRHEAAHLDGNSENDAAENLRWSTPIENAKDKRRHGTNPTGSKNAMSLLTETEIKGIFERYCDGELGGDIAADFNVSSTTIKGVLTRKSWAHVPIDAALVERAAQISRENLERSWALAAKRRRERGPSLIADGSSL